MYRNSWYYYDNIKHPSSIKKWQFDILDRIGQYRPENTQDQIENKLETRNQESNYVK